MNSRILVIVLFAAFCSHGQVSVYNQNSNEFNTGIKPTQEKKSLYDLVVLNYTDLVSIEKCKKVEIGIDLSEEIEERIQLFLAGDSGSKFPLNPFISDDLNPNTSELAIHATFAHSSTQTAKERDFFY